MFSDSPVFAPKLGPTSFKADSGMVAERAVINHLTMGFNTRTSTVTRRDYDLKRPSLLLQSRFTAEFTPDLEDYRYPLLMTSEKRGKQLARQLWSVTAAIINGLKATAIRRRCAAATCSIYASIRGLTATSHGCC